MTWETKLTLTVVLGRSPLTKISTASHWISVGVHHTSARVHTVIAGRAPTKSCRNFCAVYYYPFSALCTSPPHIRMYHDCHAEQLLNHITTISLQSQAGWIVPASGLQKFCHPTFCPRSCCKGAIQSRHAPIAPSSKMPGCVNTIACRVTHLCHDAEFSRSEKRGYGKNAT